MKKIVKIGKEDLENIITESIKNMINEAENYGWEVPERFVDEAYNFFAEALGNEEVNAAIVRCLGDETLAKCLAYLFREYDFRAWEDRLEELEAGE